MANTAEYIEYVQGYVGAGGLPSTGLFGTLVALSMCETVTLFGFDSPAEMQARVRAEATGTAPGVPYHYYRAEDIEASVMRPEKAKKVMGSGAGGGPRHGFAHNAHKFEREAFVTQELLPACLPQLAVAA